MFRLPCELAHSILSIMGGNKLMLLEFVAHIKPVLAKSTYDQGLSDPGQHFSH